MLCKIISREKIRKVTKLQILTQVIKQLNDNTIENETVFIIV